MYKTVTNQPLGCIGLRTENPRVGGSTPSLGTMETLANQRIQVAGNPGKVGTERGHRTHESRHSTTTILRTPFVHGFRP
jgi:hypothetical protein